MEGYIQERRGLFDGLKVPFDINAIILALVAVILFNLGLWVIDQMFMVQVGTPEGPVALESEGPGLATKITSNVLARLGYVGYVTHKLTGIPNERLPVKVIELVLVLAFAILLWAFFAGAISRIAAMKIAREETLDLKEACRFALRKYVSNVFLLLAPLLVVVFFYFICNATIAGWVARVPYVGEVLAALLYFLVLISSFLIVFVGALGLLGFNIAAAAVATEASDTFDGLSRAWNYILSRPWQVILTYFLTFAYVLIFCFFANWFIKVSVRSLGTGWWGLGHTARLVKIEDEDLAKRMKVKVGTEVRIPGKAEYIYKRVGTPGLMALHQDPNFSGDEVYYAQPAVEEGPPRVIDVMPLIREDGWLYFLGGAIWVWIVICKYLVAAYLLSYFFSSQTAVYFLLRRDVDGDDYTEINLEEDEDEDFFGEELPPPPPVPGTEEEAPAEGAGAEDEEKGEEERAGEDDSKEGGEEGTPSPEEDS